MELALSDTAYAYIQQKLATQEFRAGQKVSEQRLARELGISRTPVREAIHRLKNEGLIVQLASSGTFIAEPSRRQLIEMYEVRMALEAMAVVKAVRRMRPAEVARLQDYADQMRRLARTFRDSGHPRMDDALQRDFLGADAAFHKLIAGAAQNDLVCKTLSDVHLRHCAFGLASHFRDLYHVARIWLYHARIAAAVRRRDARAARRLMQQHIRFSLREALFVFDTELSADRLPRTRRPGRRVSSPKRRPIRVVPCPSHCIAKGESS